MMPSDSFSDLLGIRISDSKLFAWHLKGKIKDSREKKKRILGIDQRFIKPFLFLSLLYYFVKHVKEYPITDTCMDVPIVNIVHTSTFF